VHYPLRRRSRLSLSLSLLALISSCALVAPTQAANAYYFALQPVFPPPAAPSNLQVQSPTSLNVPAGAVLRVHLLRDDKIIATSRLEFGAAYSASALFPTPPIAAFHQTGTSAQPGQPLPGATLTSAAADLTAIAAAPDQYRFLWQLSAGDMGLPGQAVFSGNGFGLFNVRVTALAASARPHVEKPGSLLVFPYYASSLYSTTENTTVAITNTSPTEATQLRVLFYSAADCRAAEYAVCLGAQQTLSFKMSDYDPGIKGYCVAYATDAGGQPTQFNYLVGSAKIKQPGAGGAAFDATLDALTVMKRSAGAVSATNGQAELAFDDVMYDRLPNLLTLDTLPSQAGGQNVTSLLLTRLSSANVSARLTAVNATGDRSALTTRSMTCQADVKLPGLRLNPTLNTLVPADATGWMRVSATDDRPVLGLYLTTGEANTGGNLRALSYATDFRLSVPVRAVGCQ
jgi:hypothetical protein